MTNHLPPASTGPPEVSHLQGFAPLDLDNSLDSDASFQSDSDVNDDSGDVLPNQKSQKSPADVIKPISSDTSTNSKSPKRKHFRKRRTKPVYDIGNMLLSALHSKCWNVPLYVNNTRIEFLFDSGSMKTAISKDTFDALPDSDHFQNSTTSWHFSRCQRTTYHSVRTLYHPSQLRSLSARS